MIFQLKKNSFEVYAHDPLASKEIALNEYEINYPLGKTFQKLI